MLYPFQREAKEAVLRHWEGGHKAAFVSLPMGSGKTIVFSDILQSSLSGGNDKELLRQALEKLSYRTMRKDYGASGARRPDFGTKTASATIKTPFLARLRAVF
jgi:superfamily II DNA or RNA helicase